MERYIGPICFKKMPPLVRKAYESWRGQMARCHRPKATSYKYWGAKGIRVEYRSREFIAWYLREHKNFIGIDPVVSRKNHDNNYCFENIELVERAENSKEARLRTAHKNAHVIEIYSIKAEKVIAIVTGTVVASTITGINRGNISRYISGELKTSERTGYRFKKLHGGVPSAA